MSNGGRKKRRLSNLLLNRRFQLKYCFMLVGVSSIISVALGWFLVQQMRENSRMLQLEAELDQAFQAQLAAADARNVLVMVGAFVLFNVLLFFLGVFITHRMAGPIFVFRRYLLALSEGRVPVIRQLRRGDEFRELHEALQAACDGIQERTEGDITLLSRALEALEGRPGVEELQDALRAEIDEKRAAVQERTGDLRA